MVLSGFCGIRVPKWWRKGISEMARGKGIGGNWALRRASERKVSLVKVKAFGLIGARMGESGESGTAWTKASTALAGRGTRMGKWAWRDILRKIARSGYGPIGTTTGKKPEKVPTRKDSSKDCGSTGIIMVTSFPASNTREGIVSYTLLPLCLWNFYGMPCKENDVPRTFDPR